MAVSILQQPPQYMSGFNDIIFVVSSTNTAQTNFQYVCDIYITDDNGAVSFPSASYIRTKTPVDPLYSSGVFSIGDKIRNFLSYDNGTDAYGFQKSPNSIVKFVCKFGEEYGPSSAVVVTPDLATTTNFFAINSSLSDLEVNSLNYANDFGLAAASTTRRTLTNRPSSGVIRTGEDAWVSHINKTTNANFNGVVLTYNSAGALLQAYYITNPYTDISVSVGRGVMRFPSGTRNLGYLNSSHILSGQSSVSFTGVDRYQVYMVNSTSGITCEPQWYKIQDDCTDHTVYRLHFLNKLGGFDSFSFIKAHTERTEITREKFKRNKITRIGGGRYGYNNSDLSDVQYYTRHKDSIKIISDWIDEATSAWLEELITSPVIFHDHPTYGRLPINITDTSYERKQWVTDKVFNLEVNFQYSDDKYRQSL